ncbi:MAG: DUF6683 family protein [Cyanobacteria bacterium P01_G01_bin.4]
MGPRIVVALGKPRQQSEAPTALPFAAPQVAAFGRFQNTCLKFTRQDRALRKKEYCGLRRRLNTSVWVAIALVLSTGSASAFDTIASDFAFSNLQRELLDRRTAHPESNNLTTPDVQAALTFTSVPARTQANLRAFIDRTSDPRAKAELQNIIVQQPSIMADIARAMQSRYGLDPQNVAHAYTVWWITSWQAVNRRTDEPNQATILAVSRQVSAALLNTPDFLNTSDAERQEYAEALLMQTLVIGEIALAAEGDPGLQDQLAARAEQAARNNGLAVTQMQLTPNGFVLR